MEEVKCAGCLKALVNKRNILWRRVGVETAAPLCGARCASLMFDETAEHPANITQVRARLRMTEVKLRKVSEVYGVNIIKERQE